ncbi:MAG: hypothetical protein K6E51_02690 [Treponema sp.]|nr:hypothetical protein [Treponema sp.]
MYNFFGYGYVQRSNRGYGSKVSRASWAWLFREAKRANNPKTLLHYVQTCQQYGRLRGITSKDVFYAYKKVRSRNFKRWG